MGVHWADNRLQAWIEALDSVPAVIANAASSGVDAIAQEGAEEMKGYIRSRGTDYSASQGRAGRNDPSRNQPDMADAVQWRSEYARKASAFQSRFGWLTNFQNWYGLQEEGFEHIGGGTVEGMYALRDAKSTARDKMAILGAQITARVARYISRGGK